MAEQNPQNATQLHIIIHMNHDIRTAIMKMILILSQSPSLYIALIWILESYFSFCIDDTFAICVKCQNELITAK